MVKQILGLVVFLAISLVGKGQTCTITASGNWTNPGPACAEGGNAGGATILVIPAGLTLTFNDNADTWTGTRIDVYGTLTISSPGQVTINSSIVVKNGGVLGISSKLNMGTADGCGYTLGVETGGTVNIVGSTPDRLNVCGNEIARGGTAGCNPYPAGPAPYCEPTGGFTGPTGFDEDGYDPGVLPIKLVYFRGKLVNDHVVLTWATEEEESFDRFEIERAGNDLEFSKIDELPGAGYNTNSFQEYSTIDANPLIGQNYYRLKAVDLDGSYEYFNVVLVSVTGSKRFSVYPNPSQGNSIKYEINFDFNGYDRIVLFNSLGVEVDNTTVTAISDEIIFNETLTPGIYFIKYISNDFSRTVRLAVTNNNLQQK